MKLETTFLKPKSLTFLRIFILTIITLLSIRTIVSFYILQLSVESRLLIILSITLAIGLTIGLRKFRLIITEMNDLNTVKDQILLYITNNGLRIRVRKEDEITFGSSNRISNFFNTWFGTESTTVRLTDKIIIVEGHSRLINNLKDAVDSKLRLGKPLI